MMEWREVAGNSVLVPLRTRGIIHFLGGAFVAAAPQLTYRLLLEFLASQGYVVVATPFINTLDHAEMAQAALHSFEQTLDLLYAKGLIRKRYLPIYGVGHSMGAKLHLLIGSLFSVERSGNILISFNNFPARRSIPLVEQIAPILEVEFTPTPAQTNELVAQSYPVRRNLLIKFKNDDLDQTLSLKSVLQQRFPGMVTLQLLNGTHTTPIGQDVNWRVGGSFSPLDAMGQWVRQQVYQDLNQLKREIGRWLNPVAPV